MVRNGSRRQTLVLLLCLLLTSYFGYHAIKGKHGLEAYAELTLRAEKLSGELKTLEATMAAPGFYDHHETSKPVLDQHQALMWEVGDLMHRWEELQAEAAAAESQIGRPQPDS